MDFVVQERVLTSEAVLCLSTCFLGNGEGTFEILFHDVQVGLTFQTTRGVAR